ncbi:MAG TPA: ATP-binding protein [Longimicrobiales bacterium]|jgi:nitrogen fixation/metabolism regulation signal transduction histidine kinase
MLGTRSFRQRIFLAILLVALIPAAVAVVAGTLAFMQIGSTVGTLGPWDAVAESGQELIDAARRAVPNDTVVAATAAAHGEALSASVRWSRLWSFVTDRAVSVLPLLALLTAGAIALLALLTARRLSRGFSRPIQELVGWTGMIARGDPLPAAPTGVDRSDEEFQVLRTALRDMADELQEARRREVRSARLEAWTEMARRVAHEIKNPLTPMRMAAATFARAEDRAVAGSAEVLLEEIGRLDEMARSFSQFGRMPEGPPSDVDMVELLESLAAQHDGTAAAISVEATEDLPMVRGHYDVLRRAFRNLLVNAVEAVEERRGTSDGRDAVTVRLDRTADGLRVRVMDRGTGIPQELLEDVWMPDVTTKRRGTGLGLAVVRQAVDAHGGTAVARSRTDGDEGAEFEIVLPLEPATPG